MAVAEFMAHFRRPGGGIDNYSGDYPDMGSSTNVFTFGSYGDRTSASYYLFAKNMAKASINKTLRSGLAEKGLSQPQANLLIHRLQKILKDSASVGGGLCQIALYKQHADKLGLFYNASQAQCVFVAHSARTEKKTLSIISCYYIAPARWAVVVVTIRKKTIKITTKLLELVI